MILEQKVVKILREEMPNLFRYIQWDGMYNRAAEKIVKEIKEEIVKW